MNPEKAESLSPELQSALEPLLNAIESLSERIENLAQQSYPQVAVLKQIKGVGTLIALTFLLTLEDPHRFRKSRDGTPNMHRAKTNRSSRVRMEAWRRWHSAGEKKLVQ